MKNILAIDTASNYLSLALQFGGRQRYLLEQVGSQQSNFLLPRIQGLLDEVGASLADIDYIVYNRGPGSFTGLRIGLSVALGVCYATRIKLVPLDGFMLYAKQIKYHSSDIQRVMVAIDARLGQFYLAGINLIDFSYFMLPQVVNPDEIVIPDGNDIVLTGDFAAYVGKLPLALEQLKYIKLAYPNALNMLELVNSQPNLALDTLDPDLLYLRDKVALTAVEQDQSRLAKNRA